MRRITCFLLALSLGACTGTPDQCGKLAVDAAETTPKVFTKKTDTWSTVNGAASVALVAMNQECIK